MKFLKQYGAYHNSLNESKKANKEDIKIKVLEFLNKAKDILTQAKVSKGVETKVDTVYGALNDLEHDKKVSYVNVVDYSESPKRSYPYYFSLEVLTKEEAKELAKEIEKKSKDENLEKVKKKNDAAKAAKAEADEKSKKAADKRKDYQERKAKGEVKSSSRGRKKKDTTEPKK